MQVRFDNFVKNKYENCNLNDIKMKRIGIILILCLGPLIMATGQEQQAGKLLSKAIYQEEVNGELDEAIKTYRLIVQQYPDNRKVSAEALLHLGICYEKIGMPQAYDTYQDIIDKYAEQQNEVALAKKRIDHLKAYADDINEKAEQHLKKGNELFRIWEYESAIKEYEKVIELKPNTLLAQNALYYIGQSWFKAGQFDAALAAFEKLINEFPGSNMTPVTELMLERVRLAKEKDKNIKSISNSSDKGYIIDPKTSIKYTKIKSYAGSNDQIVYTSGGFNLSPDGRFMVLENTVVPVDGSDAFKLVDLKAHRSVYSPDMKKVAFYAKDAIWVAPVSAETGHVEGSPVELLDGRYRYQFPVSWSPDGKSLAFQRFDEEFRWEIWTISVSDGTLTQVTDDPGKYRHPLWSPDGKTIAYEKNGGVWFSPAEGGESRKIIDFGDQSAWWSPDGKWLYYSNWDIHQHFFLSDNQKFDLNIPREVGDFIAFSPGNNKMLFYRPSYDYKWGLKVVSVSGGPSFEPGRDLEVYGARWSPDSKIILAQGENEKGDITYWIVPFAGGEPFMLKLDIGIDGKPFPFQVSQDNMKLAFTVSHEDGYEDLYVVPISVEDARTTGPAELVFERWSAGAYNVVFSWSPDGNNLALVHEDEIWVVPLSGGKPTQITDTPEEERWINWSPDGKMISYHVDAKTKRSLNVVPASGGKSTMVLDDCKTASWSSNSQELAFLSGNNISIISLDGYQKKHIINLEDLDLDDSSSPKWSPDGECIAFIGYKTGNEDRIFTIPSMGGKVTELAPDDNASKYGLRWSPDGKWISYLTDESVKVRPEGILWEANFEEVVEKLQR